MQTYLTVLCIQSINAFSPEATRKLPENKETKS